MRIILLYCQSDLALQHVKLINTYTMKTTLRKVIYLSFVITIPALMMVGCQEDLTEPDMAHPGGVKTIPVGQNKSKK
jgi:hypothetical protein